MPMKKYKCLTRYVSIFIWRISISDFVLILCCCYLHRFLSIKIRLGYYKDLEQASQHSLPQGIHRGKKNPTVTDRKLVQWQLFISWANPLPSSNISFSAPMCFLKLASKSSYKIWFWAEGLESRQTPRATTKLELESQIEGPFSSTEDSLQY